MKYCTKCGNQLLDEAVICPKCGCVADNQTYQQNYNNENKQTNSVSIVGFIFSFFIPIVGLICGIVGLSKSKNLQGKGHGLSTAAIIISIINWIFSMYILNSLGNIPYV